jgi:8-oxo-dGTP pyrophosphatase MutT (NUDIX family)
MKTTSCGIVVLNGAGELLLCHATGGSYWDIPKGTGEAGESALQTALREAAEECGLVFAPEELLDLGRFRYRPGKDLHLFAAWTERFETRRCHCSSYFRDRFGRERPEMDGFAWVPLAEAGARASKSLGALFAQALPLPALADRLRERAHVAQPGWRNAAGPA